MKDKHISICPICGGIALFTHKEKSVCVDCEREIIPLATPLADTRPLCYDNRGVQNYGKEGIQ